jgi:hypothetical protein
MVPVIVTLVLGLIPPAAAAPLSLQTTSSPTFPELPTINSVADVRSRVEQSVCSPGSVHTIQFGNWNLDTGRDGQGRLVFWEDS